MQVLSNFSQKFLCIKISAKSFRLKKFPIRHSNQIEHKVNSWYNSSLKTHEYAKQSHNTNQMPKSNKSL